MCFMISEFLCTVFFFVYRCSVLSLYLGTPRKEKVGKIVTANVLRGFEVYLYQIQS